MTELQKNYDEAVEAYLDAFSKNHDTYLTVVSRYNIYDCADMFLALNDIRFCVDNEIDFSILSDWYWFTLETKCRINLPTYVRRMEDYPHIEDKRDYHIILLNEMIQD